MEDIRTENKYISTLIDIEDLVDGEKRKIWEKGNKYKVFYESDDSYIAETEGEYGKYGVGKELEGVVYNIIIEE